MYEIFLHDTFLAISKTRFFYVVKQQIFKIHFLSCLQIVFINKIDTVRGFFEATKCVLPSSTR